MGPVLHPLLQDLLLASGLSLGLYLFLNVTRDIQRLKRQIAGQRAALAGVVEQAAVNVRLLEPPDPRPEPLVAIAAGMTLTRRSQVLKLHRRGETPQHIAASLGLPQNEVDLLLKIHRLLVQKL